jgi:hypothetical protein
MADGKSTTYQGKVTITVEGEPQQPEGPSFWTRFKSVLKHPLMIALVAAVFTALLLPQFTRQWQDRQKERELKRSLLEQMSTASSTAVRRSISLVNGQLRAAGGEANEDGRDVYANLRNSWLIDRARVRAAIITYFPAVADSCWYSYERLVADYLGLGIKVPAGRNARITRIKEYVNSDLRNFYGSSSSQTSGGPSGVSGGPGNVVDKTCVPLKTLPPSVQARYQELKQKIPWTALTFKTTHPRYRDAYQSLGEELLIADDRIIKTIAFADAKDFYHGIFSKDWVPFD